MISITNSLRKYSELAERAYKIMGVFDTMDLNGRFVPAILIDSSFELMQKAISRLRDDINEARYKIFLDTLVGELNRSYDGMFRRADLANANDMSKLFNCFRRTA